MKLAVAIAVGLLALGLLLGGVFWPKVETRTVRVRSVQDDVEQVSRGRSATGSCGVELWSIKVMRDRLAHTVNLRPVWTNVRTLASAKAARGSRRKRSAPIETRTWLLRTTLVGFKLERDSDIHLVLRSRAGRTMIAEIPSPTCAGHSVVLAKIARSRAAFLSHHNLADGCFSCLHERVQISGVGFFDRYHGQRGIATNGVELHPVLSIRFL